MKKIIFSFLLFFVLSSPAFAQNTGDAGKLLRARGDSKIYSVSGETRYWIRTAEIFNAYRFNWRAVREVPQSELDAYRVIRVVKERGDPRLYAIESGEKRWISSPEAFNARGFNWSEIREIDPADFNAYQTGASIDVGQSFTPTVTIDLGALKDPNMPPGVDFSMLWNAWKTVQEKYRGRDTLDTQKMVYGATEGMLKSLGDPYTVFFKPVDSTKFAQDLKGSFGGIGAELGYKKGVVIIAPLKDMPAEKAGLKAGDKIIKIDGTSTVDMTVDDAVIRIRGEINTPVTLTIERAGSATLLEFTITRATITVSSVTWSKKTDMVAYIKIHNFFGAVEDDFVKAVKDAKTQGAIKFIIDLRDNPGGLLDASINIAAQFVPAGKPIVFEDFGGSTSKNRFDSFGGGLLEKTPVIVLINGGSASASEIVAGALHDSRGITLVGEKTFGKGSVQEVITLSGGASVKVTVAKWLTPSLHMIDEQGIEPDVKVELSDADRNAGRDPQLDKALELVQALPF